MGLGSTNATKPLSEPLTPQIHICETGYDVKLQSVTVDRGRKEQKIRGQLCLGVSMKRRVKAWSIDLETCYRSPCG